MPSQSQQGACAPADRAPPGGDVHFGGVGSPSELTCVFATMAFPRAHPAGASLVRSSLPPQQLTSGHSDPTLLLHPSSAHRL